VFDENEYGVAATLPICHSAHVYVAAAALGNLYQNRACRKRTELFHKNK
jgi:hypothetical protein